MKIEAPQIENRKYFLTVNEACSRYGFARSTFYRMLADPKLGLESLLVRIPPVSGRLRIPTLAFEQWLARAKRP